MNKPLRILILEDSAADADLIKYEIKKSGLLVELCRVETREEFTKALAEFMPDIVLSDYTLPSFDGKSALEIVRAAYPELPFIFVTGTLGEEIAIELLKSGATDYILKDNISKLIPAFRRAINEQDEHRYRQQAELALKESVFRLRKMSEGTIQALSMTTEIRDPYTAGHQRRVAVLASAIAAAMGLDNDTIDGILFAGMIHDIGKIVVPSSILNKTGKISDAEFALLKSHSQAGYDILRSIEFPWPIAEIILHHHERIDGSGYPLGIREGLIRPEARIIAVADVVESMAFARPYRPALGLEEAFKEILETNPKLYDGQACVTCRKLFMEDGFTFK